LYIGGKGPPELGNDLGGGSGSGGGALGEVLAGDLADGEGSGLLLGVHEGNGVGEGFLGASNALGVPLLHDLDLDAEDSLAEEDMADGVVDEVAARLPGVDHEALDELHGLGTLATELPGDDNLHTLGAGLHDEVKDTRAGAADGQPREELVTDGLGLGNGRQAAVLHLLGEELDGTLGEPEALLDDGGELTDATAVLPQDVLSPGGADDDLGALGGDTDLDTGVALLAQGAGQELVQLGVEDTISDKLEIGR